MNMPISLIFISSLTLAHAKRLRALLSCLTLANNIPHTLTHCMCILLWVHFVLCYIWMQDLEFGRLEVGSFLWWRQKMCTGKWREKAGSCQFFSTPMLRMMTLLTLGCQKEESHQMCHMNYPRYEVSHDLSYARVQKTCRRIKSLYWHWLRNVQCHMSWNGSCETHFSVLFAWWHQWQHWWSTLVVAREIWAVRPVLIIGILEKKGGWRVA